MAFHGTVLFAQNDFKAGGSSAYNNGRAQQQPAGVSKFDPSSSQTTPSFGRSRSSFAPTPQAGESLNSPQGLTSGSEVGEFAFCTVEFSDEIDVPALETGQLDEMNVKEGDAVRAGTAIAMIDSTLLKLQLMQALVRKQNAYRTANDRTAIEAAEKQIQLTPSTL